MPHISYGSGKRETTALGSYFLLQDLKFMLIHIVTANARNELIRPLALPETQLAPVATRAFVVENIGPSHKAIVISFLKYASRTQVP